MRLRPNGTWCCRSAARWSTASRSRILDELINANLYLNHPYRIPVIGWEHEIKTLDRAKAIAFYRRFYAPNNAILVVAGDVTPEEVRNSRKRPTARSSASQACCG